MPLCKALNSYRSVLQTQWFLADPVFGEPAVEDTGTVCVSVCVCVFVSLRGANGGGKKFNCKSIKVFPTKLILYAKISCQK